MKKDNNIRKHLSEKFKDFEVEPQENSWETIRFALDLKDKMNAYEPEPKDESWDKIRLVTELSEKFKDFEAEPLPQSWSKIQLATQLTEKFKNYEAEPKTETWQKIKDAIKQDDDDRIVFLPFFYRVGIAASIALLLGFGWLFYKNNQDSNYNAAFNKKPQNTDIQAPVSKKSEKIKGSTIPTNQDKTVEEGIASTQKTKAEKITSKDKIAFDKTIVLNQNKVETQVSKSKDINEKILLKKKKQPQNIISSENEVIATKTTDNNNLDKKNIQVIAKKEVEISKNINLQLLDSKNFKAKNVRLPFGVIAYNNQRPMEEKQERVRRKMILTTSLMPLQTYQALTILPQTTTYIQQVGTLNALDAQRLGLQARVGLIQPLSNRLSTGVSLAYSGIRQAISYEVNNGTYDLQVTDNQSYTLVGVGETVNQNKFLHTLGLKLDNSYLLSNKKNKIFVLGGAEAVRVLNNKDYAYYLNASVAISYPTKSGKSIWIEPTYRYSLSKSLDSYNYLQIRPSNIGLNVRVNFM